jgi:hypothetical protein
VNGDHTLVLSQCVSTPLPLQPPVENDPYRSSRAASHSRRCPLSLAYRSIQQLPVITCINPALQAARVGIQRPIPLSVRQPRAPVILSVRQPWFVTVETPAPPHLAISCEEVKALQTLRRRCQ